MGDGEVARRRRPRQRQAVMRSTSCGLLFGVVLTLPMVESATFPIAAVTAVLAMLFTLATGVCCVFWGWVMERRRPFGDGAVLVLAAIVSLVASCFVTPAQVRASQRRGDALCQALEECRAVTGEYPATLGELVPRYAAAVPGSWMSLVVRLPYGYRRDADGHGYSICFDSGLSGRYARRGDGGWYLGS